VTILIRQVKYGIHHFHELQLAFSLIDVKFGEFKLPSGIWIANFYEDGEWPSDSDKLFDLVTLKRGGQDHLGLVHDDSTKLTLWVMEEEF